MPKHKTLKEAKAELAAERYVDFVSDWIADLAALDQGRVFWSVTPDEAVASVTYGDLRKLMRQDAEIRDRLNVVPAPPKEGE